MASLALFCSVLLVYSTAVCVGQEDNSLNTGTLLREEIKKLVKDALAELMPDLSPTCNSTETQPDQELVNNVKELKEYAKDFKPIIRKLFRKVSFLSTPGNTPCLPASSCSEILDSDSEAVSGYYWIRGSERNDCASAKYMYCDMDFSCKNETQAGGWMRVASIDMTDPSSRCPSGLRTITRPRRLCSRNIDWPGCSRAFLPIHGVQYSRVCGKIIGYQQKTPDAFRGSSRGTVDNNYVDGISLTHGAYPRNHIWTFAGALHEDYSHLTGICPCINTSIIPPPPVPAFIGNDYFCDTASRGFHQYIFHPDDPLWDGAGCGPYNTCCEWNSPPWFLKNLSSPTTDNIEMRLCTDQYPGDEDINFESVEIYVQ